MKKSIFSLLLSALLLVYFSPARTSAAGEQIIAAVNLDSSGFTYWDDYYTNFGGYSYSEGDGVINIPIYLYAFPDRWDGKPVAVGVELSYATTVFSACLTPKYGDDLVFENVDNVSTVQNGTQTIIKGVMYFTESSQTKDLQIRLIDDSESECNEGMTVSITPASYLDIQEDRAYASLDIRDNDETKIAFQDTATNKVYEDYPRGDVSLLRMGDLNKTSTIDFELNDGTAHYGSDFTQFNSSRTITFEPGSALARVSYVPVNDTKGEKDKSFSVTLKNPTNATLGTNSTANVTISDDDQQYLELDKTSYEGTEGSKVTVTIKRIGKPTGIVSAYLCSCDTTAKGGLDYVETPVALVFGNGVASKTITIDLKNDDLVEGDETFMMKIVAANSSFPFSLDELSKAPVTIHDADS